MLNIYGRYTEFISAKVSSTDVTAELLRLAYTELIIYILNIYLAGYCKRCYI